MLVLVLVLVLVVLVLVQEKPARLPPLLLEVVTAKTTAIRNRMLWETVCSHGLFASTMQQQLQQYILMAHMMLSMRMGTWWVWWCFAAPTW